MLRHLVFNSGTSGLWSVWIEKVHPKTCSPKISRMPTTALNVLVIITQSGGISRDLGESSLGAGYKQVLRPVPLLRTFCSHIRFFLPCRMVF